MAQSSTPFSLLYIDTSESVNCEDVSSAVEDAIVKSCQLAVPGQVSDTFNSLDTCETNMQMVPIDDANEKQEYILLTPMACNEEKSKCDFIPANRILAESVRGLFLSNDSQSSYKSLDDNTSPEEYYEMNYDDSSSEYAQCDGKKGRKQMQDNGKAVDPFSDLCRIPLPGSLDGPYFDSKTFVRRRNERERARVRSVNEGFERLRAHLPYESESNKQRRLSKVETLQYAIQYIQHLQSILDGE